MRIQASHYYLIAVLSYLGLFALLMAWYTKLAPPEQIPVVLMLLIIVAPLLLPLRGFMHGDRRKHAWMAYLSIAYVMHGSVVFYLSAAERGLAVLEILFSSALFFGSIFYIRQK